MSISDVVDYRLALSIAASAISILTIFWLIRNRKNNSEELMTKRYFGFYPNRHLWVTSTDAGNDELKELRAKPIADKRKALIEIVFERTEASYEFAVCRDGMLLIRLPYLEAEIDEVNERARESITASGVHPNAWVDYLKLANVIFLFLESALHGHGRNNYLLELRELTKLSAFRVRVEDGKVAAATDYEIETLATLLRCGHVKEQHYDDYCFRNRFPLKIDTFDDVNDFYLRPFFENQLDRGRLDLIAKSVSELNLKNHSISLVLSWALIEGYVQRLWDENHSTYLIDNKPSSIFWVIEILKSWGVLPADVAGEVHKFRQARNAYIHQGTEVSPTVSQESLDFIKKFSVAITGIELFFNTSGPATHGL